MKLCFKSPRKPVRQHTAYFKSLSLEVKCELLAAQSCPTLCNPVDCSPPRLLCPWDFPGKDTGVDCHFLLQGIFLAQGSNQGLLHCRQILNRLSSGNKQKSVSWINSFTNQMIFIDLNVKGWKELFIGSSSPAYQILNLPIHYLTMLCTFQGVRDKWI